MCKYVAVRTGYQTMPINRRFGFRPLTCSVATAVFFLFYLGSGVFIENLGSFDSGQILQMYVVLLHFPFKNVIVSHAQCAESVASSDVVETVTSETETWLKFQD